MNRNIVTLAALTALAFAPAGGGVTLPKRVAENFHGMPASRDHGRGGKGRNKHPRTVGRNRGVQRAAAKRRNVMRHRKACRS